MESDGSAVPEDESSDEAAPGPPAPPAIVSIADFEAVDFEAPIRALGIVDPNSMFMPYDQAIAATNEMPIEPERRVLILMRDICGIGLKLSGRTAAWVPMFTWNGARSAIAEDFRGEQTVALSTLRSRIINPGLRARVSDIAWLNNRRDGASAAAAIDAYCECVLGLLDGTLKTSRGREAPREAIDFLHRGMQIAMDSMARNRRPPRISTTFEALYAAAREQHDIWTYESAADLALQYGLRQPVMAAQELEAMAASIPHGTNPMAVKRAWELAAHLYTKSKDNEGRQRCLKAAVAQILALRDEVKSSAAAKAGWIKDALLALRHVDGMEKKEYALEIELRRLQKASLKQMGSFEVDLRLEGVPEKVAEQFGNMNLSEALKRFACLARPLAPEQLRAEALETRTATPFLAHLSFNHLDGEGRTGSKSAGAPVTDEEPDETWYLRVIEQGERPRRARLVRGFINPARMVIQAKFGIAERHFNAIIGMSAFVPDNQKPIMALGFARFFQGDFMSATHLLIPQLEPCLRNLLKINDVDPSKRRDDGTEEDFSLGVLLSRFQTQFDKFLSASVAFEINRLFNAKPGPELRHKLAHGQIGAGGCFHDDVHYANWFLFHVCCLFVLPAWDQIVEPQLSEDE